MSHSWTFVSLSFDSLDFMSYLCRYDNDADHEPHGHRRHRPCCGPIDLIEESLRDCHCVMCDRWHVSCYKHNNGHECPLRKKDDTNTIKKITIQHDER